MLAETAIQKSLAALLYRWEHQGRLLWFPIPNGMRVAGGSPTERDRRIKFMKDCGLLKAGVPDIGIVFPGGQVAFVEAKSATGRTSDEQDQFFAALGKLDGWHAVIRDVDELDAKLRIWERIAKLAAQRRAAA